MGPGRTRAKASIPNPMQDLAWGRGDKPLWPPPCAAPSASAAATAGQTTAAAGAASATRPVPTIAGTALAAEAGVNARASPAAAATAMPSTTRAALLASADHCTTSTDCPLGQELHRQEPCLHASADSCTELDGVALTAASAAAAAAAVAPLLRSYMVRDRVLLDIINHHLGQEPHGPRPVAGLQRESPLDTLLTSADGCIVRAGVLLRMI